MKVGIVVKESMKKLFANNLVDDTEMERLLCPDYSKRTFNINYPVLKKYDKSLPMSEQCNVNGYPRYYAKLYITHGNDYLLCNDWYEDKNRSYFTAWLCKWQ